MPVQEVRSLSELVAVMVEPSNSVIRIIIPVMRMITQADFGLSRDLHGAWNAIEYARTCGIPSSPTKTARRISKPRNGYAKRIIPLFPTASSLRKIAAAAAVNGIDRGVVRRPSVHRPSVPSI